MKRAITILLALLMVLSLAACGDWPKDASNGGKEASSGGETKLISAVVLSTDSVSIKEGESITLSMKILPESATETVVWTSSNNSFATVNNGVVKGIKAGTVKIYASGKESGVNAVCEVTIEAPSAYNQLSDKEKTFVDVFLRYGATVFMKPETIEIKHIHYNNSDTLGIFWEVQMTVENGFGGTTGNTYFLLDKAFNGEHFLKNADEPINWSSGYDIALINRAIQEKLQ